MLTVNKCLSYITYISGINVTIECLKPGQILFLAFKFLISVEISCSFELSMTKELITSGQGLTNQSYMYESVLKWFQGLYCTM